MARMTGFFCRDEYLPKLAKLTDDEIGSLMRALMKYHADGKITDLDGKVSIAFDFIREDIDKAEVAYQKKCKQASENRRRGTGQDTTPDDVRQRQSTPVNGSDHVNICHDMEKNDKSSSLIGDDEARAIQRDHNRLYDAAEDAGFRMSNSLRASLIRLYTENGIDKVIAAMDECVRHGAANLAYLEAVLKGKPKAAKPPVKVLNAQQYDQRDYSDVQAELMAEQDREMQEFMKRNIG